MASALQKLFEKLTPKLDSEESTFSFEDSGHQAIYETVWQDVYKARKPGKYADVRQFEGDQKEKVLEALDSLGVEYEADKVSSGTGMTVIAVMGDDIMKIAYIQDGFEPHQDFDKPIHSKNAQKAYKDLITYHQYKENQDLSTPSV